MAREIAHLHSSQAAQQRAQRDLHASLTLHYEQETAERLRAEQATAAQALAEKDLLLQEERQARLEEENTTLRL